MQITAEYFKKLENLGTADLSLLRSHTNCKLDETLAGFDLFTELWWPLREKSLYTPPRDVAWLIAKLYAFCPLPHDPETLFAGKLALTCPREEHLWKLFQLRFDQLLSSRLYQLEPLLQWGLKTIRVLPNPGINWIQFIDDLSAWERRQPDENEEWQHYLAPQPRWAEQFLTNMNIK